MIFTSSIYLETATYIDSLIYGSGDKQIIGDMWLINTNGTLTYATVTRGDCFPLTESMFVPEPRKFFISLRKKILSLISF